MKFSAQEEYGLRCILQLARLEKDRSSGSVARDGGGARSLTVGEVARLEGLTPQYAGKLLSVLVKAGLLESARGRGGGIRLTRPAAEITVADVLHALGGSLYQDGTCERYTGDRKFCVHTNDCAIRSLWAGLEIMINKVLSRTTLKDLCASERTMSDWMKSHEEAWQNFHPIENLRSFEPEEVTRASLSDNE